MSNKSKKLNKDCFSDLTKAQIEGNEYSMKIKELHLIQDSK